MATASDVSRLRTANRRVATLAQRELAEFWQSLNLEKPESARDELLRFVPALVIRYGDVAATVAADWYDTLRSQARARGRFRAPLAAAVAEDVTSAQVRFGASHLFTQQQTGTLDFLTVATSKYVLAPGRDTVAQAARRDPGRPRWARVPSGAKTCDFCLDLASRGAVYASEESAGAMAEYHGNCDCVPTPVWSNDDLPAGYDPGALYDEYQARRS